jgi:hypothetical protein
MSWYDIYKLNESRVRGFQLTFGKTGIGEPHNKIPPSIFTSDEWKKPYMAFLEHWETKTGKIIPYGEIKGLPLVKLETPGDRRLTIISGVHGEEQLGPVTISDHINIILEYASDNGVGMTIYPMLSPTGWGKGRRHTSDGKSTNKMVEFQVDGQWREDVFSGKRYTDVRVSPNACQESAALYADVLDSPVPLGMLDIHQDSDMKKKGKPAVTYAYVFKKLPEYINIMHEAEHYLPLASGTDVELYDANQTHDTVDEDGLIKCNIDCTTQGAFYALGCHNAVTIETSLEADHRRVNQVNLVWIQGMIDMVAAS